jgi:hypothetical protein
MICRHHFITSCWSFVYLYVLDMKKWTHTIIHVKLCVENNSIVVDFGELEAFLL